MGVADTWDMSPALPVLTPSVFPFPFHLMFIGTFGLKRAQLKHKLNSLYSCERSLVNKDDSDSDFGHELPVSKGVNKSLSQSLQLYLIPLP